MTFMIRTFLLFILLFISTNLVQAQEPVPAIESLYVAFWPDYDNPSVLILMTGDLSPDTSLPAELTIPIPPGASVNAVASVNDGGMADTQFDVTGDTLTLITDDPRFRVEFYAPYEEDGDLRVFDYTWEAGIDVGEFIAEIQQPVNASSLTTEPAAATSGVSPNDGLTYHALAPRNLPAGTPFEMSFRYEMADPGLTAGAPPPAVPDTTLPQESESSGAAGINWLLLGAGLVILVLAIAVTWLLATRNSGSRRSGRSNRPRKPAPTTNAAKARFCHNCGAKAEKGDQFCRSCGTKLKQ
jgi:hypothetical protein